MQNSNSKNRFDFSELSEFEAAVLKIVQKIPKGKVMSYGQIAKMIKKPKAARAVGNAVGKNPFAPRVPCHRVVQSDGKLGGYSGKGGVREKIELLKKERVDVGGGKIVDFYNKKYTL